MAIIKHNAFYIIMNILTSAFEYHSDSELIALVEKMVRRELKERKEKPWGKPNIIKKFTDGMVQNTWGEIPRKKSEGFPCRCAALPLQDKTTSNFNPGDQVYITEKLRTFVNEDEWPKHLLSYIGHKYILDRRTTYVHDGGTSKGKEYYWSLKDDPDHLLFPESCFHRID